MFNVCLNSRLIISKSSLPTGHFKVILSGWNFFFKMSTSTMDRQNAVPPTNLKGAVVDLSGVRAEYDALSSHTEINLKNVDPIERFHEWFLHAQEKSGSYEEANSMALSTARDGRPTSRMVLLKGFGADGFRFFTSYDSRKGKELLDNPFASLMFYWPSINRSVRIEGKVEKLPISTAEEYWAKRPLKSQASAFVSRQSQPLKSRQELENKIIAFQNFHAEQQKPIQRPENWGGYILVPDQMEFWQGHVGRLHDRVQFRKYQPNPHDDQLLADELLNKGVNGWYYELLQP